MLWFVFWHQVPMGSALNTDKPYSLFAGGTLACGLGYAFLGLIIAALICHFLFYLVPGLLGMKTGLPLYIVGTSTYGVQGGFLMPGFLMGVLQFGWLAVNAFFAGILLCAPFHYGAGSLPHALVAIIWSIAAAFLGIKGIKYVAKVASFLPLIPCVILIVLAVATIGGVGKFDSQSLVDASLKVAVYAKNAAGDLIKVYPKEQLPISGVIALLCTYVVGFFATAGAAGCDFGMNNRNAKDVQLGGLVGIAGAIIYAGGLSLLIVAGVHGLGKAADPAALQTTALMSSIVGENTAAILWYLLAIAAFPSACFSSFIAANSFKTTLPKVNPFISCGIGTIAAIFLAVTGWAGNATDMFNFIGASFGPVCGAMAADYLLSGRKWAGPRAGFNPAGWISWIVGFAVGAFNLAADWIPAMADYRGMVPVPPLAAFIVGFVLYCLFAKLGLESKKLELPATIN
jgi:cytosine permease